ncbi:methylated-DNA--[bacterium]|nr:methylated-DNA--[protein]-cysteine S-methyltransferase [bacterium]
MKKFYYNSPIGTIEITSENNNIISIIFTDKKISSSDNSNVTKQFDEYFKGKRKNFDLKIKPKGTEFRQKVWRELTKIPYGQTKTYKEIAEAIGCKNAQRAVGQACNKNPLAIVIPCHRILSKSNSLTGYAFGIDKKEYLLNLEK